MAALGEERISNADVLEFIKVHGKVKCLDWLKEKMIM